MYSLKNLFAKNPVQISGVVVSGLAGLQLFGVVELTGDEVAWVGQFTVLVLGLFIVQTTTNTAKLRETSEVVEVKAEEGFKLATDMAALENKIPPAVQEVLAAVAPPEDAAPT